MRHFLLLLFFAAFVSPSSGQKITDSVPKKTKEKKTELRVMPYLSYNRNLDFMFGAIPMMMYKVKEADTVSPKIMEPKRPY
jgi:hypothetical protein